MSTTIGFTPTLAQFADVANQLKGDRKEAPATELRFKAIGTGFAVSWTDRFLVRVADFFSNAKTVEQHKAAVLTAFLKAVDDAHGKSIKNLSCAALSTDSGPAKTLSARAVLQLPAHTALHNALAIHKACYGIPNLPGNSGSVLTTATPALAEIVDPVVTELLLNDPAASDLLNEKDLDVLCHKYVGRTPKVAQQLIDEATSKLSQKIERELHDIVKQEPSMALDRRTILQEGQSVVRSALTQDINRIAHLRYCEKHPFADDFRAQIDASAQKNKALVNLNILSEKMLKEFERVEKARVRESHEILNQNGMTALRERLVADVIDHQAAIARIETLKLPQGTEKTEVLNVCLTIAPKGLSTDNLTNNYFNCVEQFAADIVDFVDEMDYVLVPLDQAAPGPSPQQAAFSSLDSKLWNHLLQTGKAEAADIDNFVTMGVNVFAARARPDTRAALTRHLHSDAVQTIIEKVHAEALGSGGDITEDKIRSATRLNRVIHLLSQSLESRPRSPNQA